MAPTALTLISACINQEKIVEWLNSMRLGEGGFVSTVDTVVAMQALVSYSYHSRIKVRSNARPAFGDA